jgi:hypothetical protein
VVQPETSDSNPLKNNGDAEAVTAAARTRAVAVMVAQATFLKVVGRSLIIRTSGTLRG